MRGRCLDRLPPPAGPSPSPGVGLRLNLTVTDRDTSLERGIRTIMEGAMAAYVKLPDLVAHNADAFDFSQLTTEPTAPQAGERAVLSEIVLT